MEGVKFKATVRRRQTVGKYFTGNVCSKELVPFIGKKVVVTIKVEE